MTILLVLALEYAAIRASWHTTGEITEAVWLVFVFPLNVLLVPLTFWRPKWGFPWLLALWVLIVPVNVYLLVQLGRARLEAERIVDFAYEHQRRVGSFPSSLEGYSFRDSGISSGIYGLRLRATGAFSVAFGAPGQEDVAHWYDSESGWGYYPD